MASCGESPPTIRSSSSPSHRLGGGEGRLRTPVLYRALFTLLLQQMPPELAHRLGSWSLRTVACTSRTRGLLRRLAFPGDPDVLMVRALGLTFPSPLGAAAGLDKTADWFDALGAVGFGFVEVGTITPSAQKSNPPPIIRRLPADRALVNRMGFPNRGVGAAVRRLQRRSGETIVGTNIGKARATPLEQAAGDYRAVARLVAPYADYVVLNVSSPNTAGLRDLEAVERLEPLVVAAREELGDTPLLVKISPDLDDEQIDAIADLALRLGLAGIVAVNTTIDRSVLSSERRRQAAGFDGGGVSGRTTRHSRAGGPAAARTNGSGTAGAGLGRRDRDARRCLGADPRRRDPGAGLHRLHLWRSRVAATDQSRAGESRANRGRRLDPGARRNSPAMTLAAHVAAKATRRTGFTLRPRGRRRPRGCGTYPRGRSACRCALRTGHAGPGSGSPALGPGDSRRNRRARRRTPAPGSPVRPRARRPVARDPGRARRAPAKNSPSIRFGRSGSAS